MNELNETKKLHCSHTEIVMNPENCFAQSCDRMCVAYRRVAPAPDKKLNRIEEILRIYRMKTLEIMGRTEQDDFNKAADLSADTEDAAKSILALFITPPLSPISDEEFQGEAWEFGNIYVNDNGVEPERWRYIKRGYEISSAAPERIRREG